MYDPVSGQFVFLGTNSPTPVNNINLDYLTTALQAVYGSAVPPSVTLVPSTEITSAYSQQGIDINFGNGILSGTWNSPFLDTNGFANIVELPGPGYHEGIFYEGSINLHENPSCVVINPNNTASATMPYNPI